MLTKTDSMGTTNYTYDVLNRLLTESIPNLKSTTYTYDSAGNRLTEIVVANGTSTTTTYIYNPQNRLTSTLSTQNGSETQGVSYVYDYNGNNTEERVTPYVNGQPQTEVVKLTNIYDEFNQLTQSVTDTGITVENTYNGEGYRIQKSVSQNGTITSITRYLYEGNRVVGEYNYNQNTQTLTQKALDIYGINLLERIESGNTYFYMYNGHADVTALLNSSGNTVDATYYYYAFGNVLSKTGTVNNSIRYAGYQYDEETGLYYLNARMYDPITARFMQEDTYRGDKKDPLSLNLYAYCANNPIKYDDPTGHFWARIGRGAKKLANNALQVAIGFRQGVDKVGKDLTVGAAIGTYKLVKGINTVTMMFAINPVETSKLARSTYNNRDKIKSGINSALSKDHDEFKSGNLIVKTEKITYATGTAISFLLPMTSFGKASSLGKLGKTGEALGDVGKIGKGVEIISNSSKGEKALAGIAKGTDESEFLYESKYFDEAKGIKGGADTVFKNGKITKESVQNNLDWFSGKNAEEIADALSTEGYDVTIRDSHKSKSGAKIIEINNTGDGRNISQVQVSPGGGRHGASPYVKVSTTDQGILKIVDGDPINYISNSVEKATIFFTGGNK